MTIWAPGEQERYEAWLREFSQRVSFRAQLEASMAGSPAAYRAAVENIAALYSSTHFWRVEEVPEYEDSKILANQNITT